MQPKPKGPPRRIKGEGWITFDAKRNLYIARVRHQGKPVTKYAKTEEEVLAKLLMLRNESSDGTLDITKLTLADHLQTWLSNKKDKWSPTTHQRNVIAVNKHIIPTIGHLVLSKMGPSHVENFLVKMRTKGLNSGGIVKLSEVLRAGLQYAVKLRILKVSPAYGLERPKPDHQEVQIFTDTEVQRFLAAVADSRMDPLFILAFHSGMRAGEMLGLRWADVDFEKSAVSVKRNLIEITNPDIEKRFIAKAPKNKHSLRTINLENQCMEAMAKHKHRMEAEGRDVGPTAYIFVTKIGTNISESNLRSKVFLPALKKAGLEGFTLHSLRHWHASQLLANGVSPLEVSRRLGHADEVLVLRTYGHLTSQSSSRVTQALDSMFNKPVVTK